MNEIYSQVLVARGQCTTNTHSRLADWQVNIVLKCSNPNRNPKRLVLGLIRVRLGLGLEHFTTMFTCQSPSLQSAFVAHR